ncbi:hypothetical protein [Rhodococcus koreensis]
MTKVDATQVTWREPVYDMNLPDRQDPDTGELIDMSWAFTVTVELQAPGEVFGTTMLIKKVFLDYPDVMDQFLTLARANTLRRAGIGD